MITLSLSIFELEALQAIHDRAKDDWADYQKSGVGPADFGCLGAWLLHKRQRNIEFSMVRKILRDGHRQQTKHLRALART